MGKLPIPADARVITAKELTVGTPVYSSHGWLNGPRSDHGFWRKITEIRDAKLTNSGNHMPTQADLVITLEIFPGESQPMYSWYNNDMLVIVQNNT